MAELQAGMKVRHKSGGPIMIVEKAGTDSWTGQPRVWCEWFDATNYRHTATFVPEVLEQIEPCESPVALAPMDTSDRFFERR